MAVRAHVPIMVDPEIMAKAGILPEDDIQDKDSPPGAPSPPSDERLSIFEDFLDQLETKKPDDKSEPDQDGEPDPDEKT